MLGASGAGVLSGRGDVCPACARRVGGDVNLPEAQRMARDLMDAHGLGGWTFMFDRSIKRFGACKPGQKVISLSWRLTLLNDVEQVRETVLHEIAHALTPGDGHGPKWKAMCRRLGIRPERCFTSEQVTMPAKRASRLEIGCRRCEWWADRTRFGGAGLVCRRCQEPVTYRERATGRLFRVERDVLGRSRVKLVG